MPECPQFLLSTQFATTLGAFFAGGIVLALLVSAISLATHSVSDLCAEDGSYRPED